MSTTIANQASVRAPANLIARIAGVFYVLNTVTSMYSYFGPRNRLSFDVGLVATATYIVVTVLFYVLFKPANRGLSLLAALISMAGSTMGVLNSLHVTFFRPNILIFFGFYCLLIGYLIARSTFLPRILGVLMAFGGVGYLTYLWPPLAKALYPYNVVPGALGEWTLTVWLLVKGVNEQRWQEQARTAAQTAGRG
ncbi:MAG: DUF4386 domain-containing protein [Terracidiphilus sp.]